MQQQEQPQLNMDDRGTCKGARATIGFLDEEVHDLVAEETNQTTENISIDHSKSDGGFAHHFNAQRKRERESGRDRQCLPMLERERGRVRVCEKEESHCVLQRERDNVRKREIV